MWLAFVEVISGLVISGVAMLISPRIRAIVSESFRHPLQRSRLTKRAGQIEIERADVHFGP